MKNALFISIKPEFILKILEGEKTIELRKLVPKIQIDDTIYLYSTSPEMAVVGICKVKNIIVSDPKTIWENNFPTLGIDEKRYYKYFQNKTTAVAIYLKDVEKLKKPISLITLKNNINNFHPPQSYRYFNKNKFQKLFSQYFN